MDQRRKPCQTCRVTVWCPLGSLFSGMLADCYSVNVQLTAVRASAPQNLCFWSAACRRGSRLVSVGLSNVLGEIERSHRSVPAPQHLLGPSPVYEPPPDFSSKAELRKDKKTLKERHFTIWLRVTYVLLRKLDKCRVSFVSVKKPLSCAWICSFFSFHHQCTLLFLCLISCCLTLLCCPSHSLSTSSVALLWPFYSILPSFIPKLITSLNHFFIFSPPPSHVVSSSPPILGPLPHLLVFCCVSCSAAVD